MHQALYRKYRPATFDDVCGQKHITDILRYETESGRISHAYLFCGSRGTGKTSCAKIMAKAVNCEAPVNGSPCLKCRSCLDIDAGLTTDVVEMDAASHNGVDEIRALCDDIMYTPAMLKKRVYIIDEVHMLSQGAFNALLKTIEEPPEHAVFILATTELHKVPATIVSRCQRFGFNRIDMKVIAERLKYIAKCENIVLEDEAALLLARQAQGGMRDAIGLLELCSAGGADVTAAKVTDALGISGYELVARTMDAVSRGDMATLFAIVADVNSSAKDISVFWQELISFVRDMLVSKYTENSAEYLDLTEAETELLKKTAAKFSLSGMVYISGVLDDAAVRIARSPQTKRIIAETALLKMCRPELDSSSQALEARISKLEDSLALGEFGSIQKKPDTPPAPAVESTSTEENGAKNDSAQAAPPSPETPVTTASADGEEYTKISDISEAVGRLEGADRALAGFLMSAAAFVSADKKHLRLEADSFSATMLERDSSKKAVSCAFARAGLTEGKASVEVKTKNHANKSPSPSDELGGLL